MWNKEVVKTFGILSQVGSWVKDKSVTRKCIQRKTFYENFISCELFICEPLVTIFLYKILSLVSQYNAMAKYFIEPVIYLNI